MSAYYPSTVLLPTASSSFSSQLYYQLTNACIDKETKQVIGGELTVAEYDSLNAAMFYKGARIDGTCRDFSSTLVYTRFGADFQVDAAFEDAELFVTMARDKKGSQLLQQYFPIDRESRADLVNFLIASGVIVRLAKDVFGNFVIQKIIEEADENYDNLLFFHLKSSFFALCKNRYSCRVAQKMIEVYPVSYVYSLVCEELADHEVELVKDPHASHVILKIIVTKPESVFASIVCAISASNELFKSVVLDKYGCRIVQQCLDRLVKLSDASLNGSLASTLLDKLVRPILSHALEFSKDEFANYVVQFIIITELFEKQRLELIRKVVVKNLLVMAQERYASHVLEKALQHSPPEYLSIIIEEILCNSASSTKSRDTLSIMLFDQYGNYVVQRLLYVLIEVKNGQRLGDAMWFDRLAKRLLADEDHLLKYSSGKKIIEVLEAEFGEQLSNF